MASNTTAKRLGSSILPEGTKIVYAPIITQLQVLHAAQFLLDLKLIDEKAYWKIIDKSVKIEPTGISLNDYLK